MVSSRLLISVLALAVMLVPASASTLTYCVGDCNQLASAFASATSSLYFGPGAPSIYTFVSSGLVGGGIEYDDPTGVIFFGFASNGTTPAAMSVSGTTLQGTVGGVIKVTLPASAYAFAANLRDTSGTGIYCIDPASSFNTGSDCLGRVNVPTSPAALAGVANSTTPIPTVWFGPSMQTPTLLIDSFELGTQQQAQAETSEAATLVLIGSGLICLRLLRRHRQKASVSPPPDAVQCARC